MYLCESCAKGQIEMCPYFRENFLESGELVRECPEFEAEASDGVEVVLRNCHVEKTGGPGDRCAEQTIILTVNPVEHAESLLQSLKEKILWSEVNALRICFETGEEIVIGGKDRVDQ